VFPNEKCELPAGCTEDRRAGQQAAQKRGLAGCGNRRGGLQKKAVHWAVLQCSLPACPSVQLASPQKIENTAFQRAV